MLVLNKGNKSNLVSQLIEADAAYNLGTQNRQEPFALERVLLVKVIRHHGTQHGIAKILKTLIIDTMTIMLRRERTMDKSYVVQLRMSRSVAKAIFKETVEFLALVILTAKKHAG